VTNKKEKTESTLQDKVVSINRVAKVVKGGRRFSFSALVVVGDSSGSIGFAVGKANEVPDAIKKGSEQAKKNLRKVSIKAGTLACEIDGRHGASIVKMYPAKEGKGVIAGGAVRMVVELAGYKDIVCKVHGSKNSYNVVRATFDGLEQIASLEENTKLRQV
jgi:small subunit ribosomal protein S5